MTAELLREYLRDNLTRECRTMFGLEDSAWIERAVGNWFDDERNYDRRWHVILARRPAVGRVLDVAAGCGTFMLYGLRNGQDVIGIEPEEWKREFYARKLELGEFPATWASRMVAAVGEELPFADESFDVVSTYQTLEHVRDVEKCLREMLRVTRVGGVLYLRAPDYNCFFEPHYRLPFLPRMNRELAGRYISMMGRPVVGLKTLNWTSERQMVAMLRRMPWRLHIEHTRDFFIERRRQEVEGRLPRALRRLGCARVMNEAHQAKRALRWWMHATGEERVIDLWIVKQG